MTTKLTGFIINKKDFREADRLFTIYTKELGKVTAMAQGSRKLSSKLSGNLELLHHATFTIAKGKQIDRIATVDLIESHEEIKSNLDALTIALYCCDLCDRSIKEGVADVAVYDLLADFFGQCSIAKSRYAHLAHLFILKLSTILGYQPSAKGFERISAALSKKCLADVMEEKLPVGVDGVIQGCLASLVERPSPSQVFFDFLVGAHEQKKSITIK